MDETELTTVSQKFCNISGNMWHDLAAQDAFAKIVKLMNQTGL